MDNAYVRNYDYVIIEIFVLYESLYLCVEWLNISLKACTSWIFLEFDFLCFHGSCSHFFMISSFVFHDFMINYEYY